jgi:triacylglycerol lipase
VRTLAILSAALLAAAAPSAAGAADPRLTVDRARLAAALECHGKVGRAAPPPIVFAPGTGSDASRVYTIGKGAFDALGRGVCIVAFPGGATGDLQVSVQYLVHAIRKTFREAGRPVAVAGVSQGGLLARLALTYWPSLRRQVADVISAAAPHHGAAGVPLDRCRAEGCLPAVWQQASGSRLIAALDARGEETPGPAAWTTVRSATDEVVLPQVGRHPTSSLRGAANILIQDVCPGRVTTHLGTVVDSVTIAALADAIDHRGPARISRLPGGVCAHPYGTGLDEGLTSLFLTLAPQLFAEGERGLTRVRKEPRLRPWMRP